VRNWVEREATRVARGLVAKIISRDAVHHFVDDGREDNDGDEKDGRSDIHRGTISKA